MKKLIKIMIAVCSVLVFSTPISASSEYLKLVERIEFGNGYMKYMFQVDDGLILGGPYEGGSIVLKLDKQNKEVWRYTINDIMYPHIQLTSDGGVLVDDLGDVTKVSQNGEVEWKNSIESEIFEIVETNNEYLMLVRDKTNLPLSEEILTYRLDKTDGSVLDTKQILSYEPDSDLFLDLFSLLPNNQFAISTAFDGETVNTIHIYDSNFNEIRSFTTSGYSNYMAVHEDLILCRTKFGYDMYTVEGDLVHSVKNDIAIFKLLDSSMENGVVSTLQMNMGSADSFTQYSLSDNSFIRRLAFDRAELVDPVFSQMVQIGDLIYVSAAIENKSTLLIYKIMSDEEKKEEVVVDNNNTVDPVNKQATLPATGDDTQTNLYVGLACLAAFVVYRVRKNQI